MGGGGGPVMAAPVAEPETKKTRVDPNRDEEIAAAARRRQEIMKRRGRAKLRTDLNPQQTREGTATVG